MRRLFRLLVLAGLAGLGLFLIRSLLKRWVDGPPVTRSSSGWPPPAGMQADEPPGKVVGRKIGNGSDENAAARNAQKTAAPKAAALKVGAQTARAQEPGTQKSAARGSSAQTATPRKRSAPRKQSGQKATKKAPVKLWIAPSGSAELLETHPVKAKVASRLYRVPGMPMYERTVADRCYPSPEAAERDGFTRATR